MNISYVDPLPARPSLEQYRKQAKDLTKLVRSGEAEAIQRVKKYHPRSHKLFESGELIADFGLADAQITLAREHGFESWPKFAKHIEALTREGSPVSRFEAAADAIVKGDAAVLARLLHEEPGLVKARSTRLHGATLLHYLGANGLEGYRQKSPKNAVALARMLLEAGAEVDAQADIYGRDTALGLVATSIHPKQAGVQIALLEILLEFGAATEGTPGERSPLLSALHNGRREAAEFLAERGAQLDLEGAAGLGRLDEVESFFDSEGHLKAHATRGQMDAGLWWACEYGRNGAVEFLLNRGADLRAKDANEMTGLHWAVAGGQLETVRLLVARGAPLDAVNHYGGTALGQALWSQANGDSAVDYAPIIELLLQAGAAS